MPRYTTANEYDVLVVIFYSIRISGLAVIGILCAFQSYYEIRHLRAQKKPINPRFLTFASLTLFPIFRALSCLVVLFYDDDRDFGHLNWFFDRLGTYFIFQEWIFIGCFWTQLLYTFFVSNAIILKNSDRAWKTACICAASYGIYTITLLTLGMINVKYIIRWQLYLNVVFYFLYGGSIVANGAILVKYMKSAETRIPRLEQTIKKTTRLAIMLGVLVVAVIVLMTGFSPLPVNSDWRYLASFIFMVLEFAQSYIVMAALGGETPRNYFLFRRVNETASSNSSKKSGGSSSGGNSFKTHSGGATTTINNGNTCDVSLKEMTSSSGVDVSSDSVPHQRPQSVILTTVSVQTSSQHDLLERPDDDVSITVDL
eukprot:gene12984-15269_t